MYRLKQRAQAKESILAEEKKPSREETENQAADPDDDNDKQNVTFLDLDIDDEMILHTCTRKSLGMEPLLHEFSANDCVLGDDAVRWLVIFVKTNRFNSLKIGGNNLISASLRLELQHVVTQLTSVDNMERGFITTKTPIVF